MKAIIQENYGSAEVLELRDVEKPRPGDDELLIRVHAAGLDPGVWHLMTGLPYLVRLMGFGLRKPKIRIRGMDVAGTVEVAGRNVTQLKEGDQVYGTCDGSFAEYACAKAERLAPKPANLSFEQAAAVPVSGMTALNGLRDAGKLQPEQKVLIIGAAGGVGTYAVQLAKAFGGVVTGVCSTSKAELVRGYRRRRSHRLHPRGLHRRDAPIRPHPRHRGQAAPVAPSPGPCAARHARHRRRRRRRPLAWRLSTPDLCSCARALHGAEADGAYLQGAPAGPIDAQRPDRSRQAHPLSTGAIR